MSYREKTPAVVSILKRKLKPGKTIEDFQIAHVPGDNPKSIDFGYEVDFFGVPTRVINAVSAEDPSIIYSIGLSYGSIDKIFTEAAKKSQDDAKPGHRSDKLDNICDDLSLPIIAFVSSDNNYGGSGDDYQQTPIEKVTPEISDLVKKMLKKKPTNNEDKR